MAHVAQAHASVIMAGSMTIVHRTTASAAALDTARAPMRAVVAMAGGVARTVLHRKHAPMIALGMVYARMTDACATVALKETPASMPCAVTRTAVAMVRAVTQAPVSAKTGGLAALAAVRCVTQIAMGMVHASMDDVTVQQAGRAPCAKRNNANRLASRTTVDAVTVSVCVKVVGAVMRALNVCAKTIVRAMEFVSQCPASAPAMLDTVEKIVLLRTARRTATTTVRA